MNNTDSSWSQLDPSVENMVLQNTEDSGNSEETKED